MVTAPEARARSMIRMASPKETPFSASKTRTGSPLAAKIRGSLSPSSSAWTTSLLIRRLPSFRRVRTGGGSSRRAGSTFVSLFSGTCTQNCFTAMGVTTMKMIRRTSTTSTRGVTFSSGLAPRLPGFRVSREVPMGFSSAVVCERRGDLLFRPLGDGHRHSGEMMASACLIEPSHFPVGHVHVGADHHPAPGIRDADGGEALVEDLPADGFVVHGESVVREDDLQRRGGRLGIRIRKHDRGELDP